jgi:hypothetical protein
MQQLTKQLWGFYQFISPQGGNSSRVSPDYSSALEVLGVAAVT